MSAPVVKTTAEDLFNEIKDYLNNEEKSENINKPLCGAHQFLGLPLNLRDYDEVCTDIYIGNREIAQDVKKLRDLKITHVLNAAHGQKLSQINTDPSLYEAFNICLFGVPAMDFSGYRLDEYFRAADAFIKEAIDSGGRCYVHCHQGRSRSASLVLAHLIISHRMDLISALKFIRQKRSVRPNDGFLRQLCRLQVELNL